MNTKRLSILIVAIVSTRIGTWRNKEYCNFVMLYYYEIKHKMVVLSKAYKEEPGTDLDLDYYSYKLVTYKDPEIPLQGLKTC